MDISEYLKDARRAHFAVIALGLGLVMLAEIDQSSERREARLKLRHLQEELQYWDSKPFIEGVNEEASANMHDSGAGSLAASSIELKQCDPFDSPWKAYCFSFPLSGSVTYRGTTLVIPTTIDGQMAPAIVPAAVTSWFMPTSPDLGSLRRLWDGFALPPSYVTEIHIDHKPRSTNAPRVAAELMRRWADLGSA